MPRLTRLTIVIALLTLLTLLTGAQEIEVRSDSFTPVAEFNRGLLDFSKTADEHLNTPQSTLAFFVRLGSQGKFDQAAAALDLRSIDEQHQAQRGEELARMLYEIMDRHVGFPFSSLPDVADGRQPLSPGTQKTQKIKERETFLLGNLSVPNNQFEIRLTRHRVGEDEYLWLFSRSSVEQIEDAYQRYGLSDFERAIPDTLKIRVLGRTPIWAWLLLITCLVVCGVVYRQAVRALDRFLDADIIREIRMSLIVALTCWTTQLLLFTGTPLPGWVSVALLLIGCFSLVWVGSTIITMYSQRIVRGDLDTVKELDDKNHTRQKTQLTYLSIGRRVLSFFAVVFAGGLVVTSFPEWRTTGTSILASAGVLSILLGIAAQPVLGNLIAGIQILVSRPIRVGDAIEFEGTWAYVEEITHMYVLCCTWDEKRLIIPLSHFISQPFENYSLRDSLSIRTIHMELDFGVDVKAFREELVSYAQNHELATKRYTPKVQVVSCNRETVTIRSLVASEDANSSWDLHCDVREHMLEYVMNDQRESLPRERVLSLGESPVKTHAMAGDG